MPTRVKPTIINHILSQYGYQSDQVQVLSPENGYRNSIYPIQLVNKQKLALIFFKPEPDILKKIKASNLTSNFLANQGWPTRRTITPQSKLNLESQAQPTSSVPAPTKPQMPNSSLATANNAVKQAVQSILHIQTRATDSQPQSYYCCLYNYLPGSTLNWDSYQQDHIKLLGQTLGYLHQSLRQLPDRYLKTYDKEILNLQAKLKEMKTYFNQNGVLAAAEQKLKLQPHQHTFVQFEQLLSQLKNLQKAGKLQSQLLHLDFVRSNILFELKSAAYFQAQPEQTRFSLDVDLDPSQDSSSNKLYSPIPAKDQPTQISAKDQPAQDQSMLEFLTITGILDFEKTALGPKLLDIARTLAFLLVDCRFKQPEQVIKYFINSGYVKRGGQQLAYPGLIQPLVQYFLYYDFYKFLCHNPYQSLPRNQHFVRTKQFLLQFGLVREV